MSGSGTTGGGNRRSWSVDVTRLWIGGVMAGVVGAGIVLVGFLVARGILDVPVLIEQDGELVDANVWWYALGAFGAALVATGLLHVLLIAAPRPFTFYGWITGLAVVIAGLIPFTTPAKLATEVTLCAINLAAGTVMAAIIATVGRSALRGPSRPPYDAGGPPYPGGSPYGQAGPYGQTDQYGQPDPYRRGDPPYRQGDQPGNW
jgi:hypothetical protein